jgi:hypothetical protein
LDSHLGTPRSNASSLDTAPLDSDGGTDEDDEGDEAFDSEFIGPNGESPFDQEDGLFKLSEQGAQNEDEAIEDIFVGKDGLFKLDGGENDEDEATLDVELDLADELADEESQASATAPGVCDSYDDGMEDGLEDLAAIHADDDEDLAAMHADDQLNLSADDAIFAVEGSDNPYKGASDNLGAVHVTASDDPSCFSPSAFFPSPDPGLMAQKNGAKPLETWGWHGAVSPPSFLTERVQNSLLASPPLPPCRPPNNTDSIPEIVGL